MPFDSTVGLAHADTITVRGPADLLHLVPYLLGFHPSDSFVAVGLRHSRVVVTGRCDLADAAVPERRQQLTRALVQAEAREVIVIVYGSGPAPAEPLGLPHGELVAQFGELTERAGLDFVDALLLADGRWWSYCCSHETCCFAQGQPLETRAPSAVAAAATVAGLVALPDRAALAAQLDPDSAAERDALQPLLAHYEAEAFDAVLTERTRARRRALVRALFAGARRADAGDLALSDDDVARFGVALSEVDIRDSVWLAVDDQRIGGRELWRLLARRLPTPYDAAPLFLVGWRAWRDGNGALAVIAAQRAVDSDAGFTPADLLLAALDDGVDPHRLPTLRPGRLRVSRTARSG